MLKDWFETTEDAILEEKIQNDIAGASNVDLGCSVICLMASLVKFAQGGMFFLLDKSDGGENFAEGNKKYRKAYDYSIIALAAIQIVVMSICYGIESTT